MKSRLVLMGVVAAWLGACAKPKQPTTAGAAHVAPVSGVWDGLMRETVEEGMSAGDTRIERQEWHLSQVGAAVSGYYVVALTMVSGDGRPYVCNRQPKFSSLIRFDVKGRISAGSAGSVDLDEVTQAAAEGTCNPGARRLFHYHGQVQGDVLTLTSAGQHQTLYRRQGDRVQEESPLAFVEAATQATPAETPFPGLSDGPSGGGGTPADVSGMWVWEHQSIAPGGDEKQEREEWHVTQEGGRLTGYYDRIVRQISTDGHAYRCSMAIEFRIATRYRITGAVRGDDVVIYENTYEVLDPNPCDNGKRRLDTYQGRAAPDEIRLMWSIGQQVLRRSRPDVPTQRF